MITNGNLAYRENFYYDTETKNGSFIKLHYSLKQLGIKNNKFFLKIYDRSLIGVDPYAQNLPTEIKAKILAECIRNIWYYLREVVRVTTPAGLKRYRIHRGNLALTWCFVNNINSYTELPRQNFKTVSTCANFSWALNLSTKNSQIAFINKKQDNANKNLDDVRKIRDSLPQYLRFDKEFKEDGSYKSATNNVKELVQPKSGSSIKTYPSARTTVDADNLGRGFSQPLIYFDEFAFTKFIDIIYAAAAPSFSQASSEARSAGMPYGMVVTSTPGDLSTPHGLFAKQFIENAAKFTEKLYDFTIDEVEEYISANSQNDFMYIKFSYKQLGRSEEWFREQCRKLNQIREKIRREVLLEWGVGSGDSPFEPETLEVLEKHKVQPVETIMIHKYFALNFYEKYDYETPVIISIDVAGGLGRDASALTAINARTGQVVATFKNNKIGIKAFSKLIYFVTTRIFFNCVIAIERNNQGLALLEILMDLPMIEGKLYKDDTKDETIESFDNDGYLKFDMVRRKGYGVYTAQKNREVMMDLLQEYVERSPERVRCQDLIDEIKGLVINKSGKIVAGSTTKDDMVMSYVIGLYIRHHGKNLSKYGLQKFMNEEEREKLLKEDADEAVEKSLTDFIHGSNDSITASDLFDMMGDHETNPFLKIGQDKTFYDLYKAHDLEVARLMQKNNNSPNGIYQNDYVDKTSFNTSLSNINDFSLDDD